MSPSETLADLLQAKLKLFMICVLSTIQDLSNLKTECASSNLRSHKAHLCFNQHILGVLHRSIFANI